MTVPTGKAKSCRTAKIIATIRLHSFIFHKANDIKKDKAAKINIMIAKPTPKPRINPIASPPPVYAYVEIIVDITRTTPAKV